jgi:heterodisulfide reductase subunit D
MRIDERAEQLGVSGCVTCGRCTWACPVSRRPGDFSPRTLVERFLREGRVPNDRGIWSCTNCAMCSEVCDSGVRFHEFIRDLRGEIVKDVPPEMTHGGIVPSVRRLTSMPHISPRKNTWVTDSMELDPGSGTLLFVGCVPYFDVMFRDFRDDLLEIPRAAVSLLNAMGVKPALIDGERCCGHDAYWMGDMATLENLARLNIEAIEARGTDRVVFTCPEGYWTFKELYPRLIGPLGFRVENLAELLGNAIKDETIVLERSDMKITFQDPCRLGRYSGIVDEPRTIIDALGVRQEMERTGRLSACCGHSNWVNCDTYTRDWQLERLREAESTGSEVLVTACPKCLIHLTCAQRNLPERGINIKDIYVMAASALKH